MNMEEQDWIPWFVDDKEENEEQPDDEFDY